MFLLGEFAEERIIIPVCIRPKTDKIGQNLSPENPFFEKEIETLLALIVSDLQNDNLGEPVLID